MRFPYANTTYFITHQRLTGDIADWFLLIKKIVGTRDLNPWVATINHCSLVFVGLMNGLAKKNHELFTGNHYLN